jgi:hypothetical protein
VNFEEAQLEACMDACRCVHCNAESSVKVFPDLPKNKWKCEVCNKTNLWKPSELFAKMFGLGFGSAQPPLKNDINSNPNKEMGKLTLDALAKMDRGDVEKMSAGDALDTLVACDDAAGGLNEAIGMAAQKGYNQEFVSGVIADLGKLRNLKQLLTGKLEQEVV